MSRRERKSQSQSKSDADAETDAETKTEAERYQWLLFIRLCNACVNGDLRGVKGMIRLGVDVNKADDDG